MRKNALLVGAFLAIFYFISQFTSFLGKGPVVENDGDEKFEARPIKMKRGPASVGKSKTFSRTSNLYRPEVKVTVKDEKKFAPEVERGAEDHERSAVDGHKRINEHSSVPKRSVPKRTASVGATPRTPVTKSTPRVSDLPWSHTISAPTSGFVGGNPTNDDFKNSEVTDSGGSGQNSSGGGNNGSGSLTCSANQGGGVYGNPILVAITCSTNSTIRYCLSDTGCCDPGSGSTYSSSILVGATDGDFCLSFQGESTNAESVVTKLNFTITSGLPHLQVAHPKINYQTTELHGMSFLSSNDFGRSHYELGQVNLKTHDPGPMGLNLGCKDMLENYVLYPPVTPTPNPNIILSIADLATINPGLQIEIPLTPSDLSYGDNFIMSYVVDQREATPEYACSTQKVVLNDFEYFDAHVFHGVPGTSDVREFSGGFSPYGFFEEETTVYRGPAGISSEDQNGQRLEAGLFEIFY